MSMVPTAKHKANPGWIALEQTLHELGQANLAANSDFRLEAGTEEILTVYVSNPAVVPMSASIDTDGTFIGLGFHGSGMWEFGLEDSTASIALAFKEILTFKFEVRRTLGVFDRLSAIGPDGSVAWTSLHFRRSRPSPWSSGSIAPLYSVSLSSN